jgi:hypothetical protein
MKRFRCQCGHEVTYESLVCQACGRDLAFSPSQQKMLSLASFKQAPSPYCAHRFHAVGCNWLVEDGQSQCVACRSTRQIPAQYIDRNSLRWAKLEVAKRRMFFNLLTMGLPLASWITRAFQPLRFDFLEDRRSNPDVDLDCVLTGHFQGLVTINAAEADEGYLHDMKEKMGEGYRTLLGHFRHEVGHFVWDQLFVTDEEKQVCRRYFGDERIDYTQALAQYYERGARRHWQSSYISQYATAHPFEDWAETWAHFLHITDTLETAYAFGITPHPPSLKDDDDWYTQWQKVTHLLNSLNRSMGLSDGYPFMLQPAVVRKLKFIHYWVEKKMDAAQSAS